MTKLIAANRKAVDVSHQTLQGKLAVLVANLANPNPLSKRRPAICDLSDEVAINVTLTKWLALAN